MSELNKKLAKVSSFGLNIRERGILMFSVHVNYEDGFSQGVGGLVLDDYDKDSESRIGTAYGCEMIRQLMIFFDVDDFSKAKDKMVYVLGEGEGFQFKAKGMETLYVDGEIKTILFDEIYNKFNSK